MTRPDRRWMLGTAATLVVVALAAAALLGAPPRVTRSPLSLDSSAEGYEGVFGGTPKEPGYPNSWKADSLTAAMSSAEFTLLLPDHPLANRNNVVSTYVFPGGRAVAIEFPPPAEPKEFIRQEYIEVYEAAWLEDADPLQVWEQDLKNAPSPAKRLIDISGVPVLSVEAHSPKDELGHSNPAFLRFVTHGVEVQVSGGESVDDLVGIARTIIAG